MNILDESTKAMLDAGSTAVLNGGYLVMTPETLRQVVQTAVVTTVEAFDDAVTEEANDSSICSICGGDDIVGTACSVLVLEAGYGSANDMERVKVPLCGGCCDKLFSELVQLPGAVAERPW